MDRYVLSLFLVLVCSLCLSATPQHPDLIIVDGDTTTLVWWLPKGPLDEALLREQKPDSYSTACWDGYYRLWEIRNDSLFLNSFQPCNGNIDWACAAGDFYPKLKGKEVFASWVNQEVYVASDTLITYYDIYPIYAREQGYQVTAGIVGASREYNNGKTRMPDQRNITRFVYDNLPWGTFPDTNRTMVISFRVDSLERPTDVQIPRSNGPLYDSIGLKLLEQLPPIPVYYFHGKPLGSRWMLPIIFNEERYRKRMGKGR